MVIGCAAQRRSEAPFLAVPYLVIRALEGENDGLVSVESAKWTGFTEVLRGPGRKGISHPDSVDLRRRRFSHKAEEGFVTDIRDVYIGIVAGLAERGL